MLKNCVIFLTLFTLVFIADQSLKQWTLQVLCEANIIENGKIFIQENVMENGEMLVQNIEVSHCSARKQLFGGEYISLVGTLNTGVAFSMFSEYKEHLKFVHLGLLVILFVYLLWQRKFFKEHLIAFSLMFGAGFSNLLDRFLYGGVVDMFFWHKWFEFAIFNIADATINLSIAIILIKELFFRKKPAKSNEWAM